MTLQSISAIDEIAPLKIWIYIIALSFKFMGTNCIALNFAKKKIQTFKFSFILEKLNFDHRNKKYEKS